MLGKTEAGGEEDNRGCNGWMASPTKWTWVWAGSGRWWRTGRLVCCSPRGHKESDPTYWLNSNKNWKDLELCPFPLLPSAPGGSRGQTYVSTTRLTGPLGQGIESFLKTFFFTTRWTSEAWLTPACRMFCLPHPIFFWKNDELVTNT